MTYYIYKICCDDCPDFVYVGSTKAFRQRKAHHKHDCNNENRQSYNQKIYTTIRENGGWDNWRMVIIEDCGEISFTQARIKEEEHRMKLNANLNSQKCYVTEEQNKERDNLYTKERRNGNLEYKEYLKEYNKQYREANKEYYKEYDKEYRENNKEVIKEKRSKKITCECGKTFRYDNIFQHKKSKIHCEFIKNNLE